MAWLVRDPAERAARGGMGFFWGRWQIGSASRERIGWLLITPWRTFFLFARPRGSN